MDKILAKLTSRKLWISVAAFICGVVLIVAGEVDTGAGLIIVAVGGYTIPESIVDAARLVSNRITVSASTNSKETVEAALNVTKEQ